MDLLIDIVAYLLLAFFTAASAAVLVGWCLLAAEEAQRNARR